MPMSVCHTFAIKRDTTLNNSSLPSKVSLSINGILKCSDRF